MRQHTVSTSTPATKTFVLYPQTFEQRKAGIDADTRLEEACGLARAIHLDLCDARWVFLKEIKSNTFIGGGLIEELNRHFETLSIELVVIDGALSPVQQRNLEKAWGVKVIDRTGLILEIFGERATTAEGRLQVEHAAVVYEKSRLVRSWTHLERQRGGTGATGGPGERQLELDKRLLNERIKRITKDLDKIKKRRTLQRTGRQKVPYPVVALVGYTNAGKSTLFNQLTNANVLAQDMLFATLDPTLRQDQLPSGRHILFSDTVGFITDLPTQLVAAFHATLEEVQQADIILHIRDASNPHHTFQATDVEAVLQSLDINPDNPNILTVFNKIDLLSPAAQEQLQDQYSNAVFLSALSGSGCQHLKAAIDQYFDSFNKTYKVTLPAIEGKALAWLYRHGHVRSSHSEDHITSVMIKLAPKSRDMFKATFPDLSPNIREQS